MGRKPATTYLPGLKALMAGRKLSAVAADLDLDTGFLSQLVSCKRGPSLTTTLRLARYFGTPVEALLAPPRAPEPGTEN